MTETNGERRNRLLWRTRRGARELDGLLMPFAESILSSGGSDQIALLEEFLAYPDPVILDWVFDRQVPEDPAMAQLVQQILNFSRAHRP